MKVTVNQQVITRPEVLKANKPGFQNFGKNVKVNTLGQLVNQDGKAKELKKAFGLENAFKDMGYQNIDQNAKDFDLQGVVQKSDKESESGFQDVGQKSEKAFGFKHVGQKGGFINIFA